MSKEASGSNARTLELINKMIERETRYADDAEKRKDRDDSFTYSGRISILQELRDTLTGEWKHGPKKERTYGSGHPYN